MTLDIGKKLDTIAQLLAGAPPGPEEKFLFQKYVYCKEDYTSWVVSLLGDLGIAYTQVGSLVNGLYEYRCECTNDQFNQLILKVELSTNPVLATYKKIDSFSDLIGINVFDMDSFAAGCDSRISRSTTIVEEMIEYWINVQNGQIVQRQLDLAGSANIGTYSIDFTGGNVISGSVPVNGSIRDNILYRKQITGSAFGFSLTNCTIEGWIIDYLKRSGNASQNSTITTQYNGQGANVIDDDISTGQYRNDTPPGNTWFTVWAITLDAPVDISELHLCHALHASSGSTCYGKLEISSNGSDWTDMFVQSNALSSWQYYSEHDISRNDTDILYIRYRGYVMYSSGSYPHMSFLYDLSIF